MASKFSKTVKNPIDYVLNGKVFDKNLVFSNTNKNAGKI